MKAKKQVQTYFPNKQKLTLKLHRTGQQNSAEKKSQPAPIIIINPAKISEKAQSPFKIRRISKDSSSKQLPTLTLYQQDHVTRVPSGDLSQQYMHRKRQEIRVSQMNYIKHKKLSSQTVIQEISFQNRKRATSLDNKPKIKSLSSSDNQRKNPLKELMNFLHQQGFIDKAVSAYSIRKDKLLEVFSGMKFEEKGGKIDKVGQLLSFVHRITTPRQRISINSQVFSLNLNSTVLLESYSHFHFKVEKLMAQEIVLSESIASKESILSALILKITQQSDLLLNSRMQFNQLQESIQEKTKNCLKLQNQIQDLTKKLLSVDEVYNTSINFCERQDKNKILKLIAKQFKQIQSQIFEYAVYLQSNQMAHDLSFEPKPFQEMERLMLASLAELSNQLLQNKTKTVDRKCKQMSDFLHECLNKFHKKDVEVGKLTEFRTKCVHTFIHKMKLWLTNWELKQEYLFNLKKEFIANHAELLTILQAPIKQEGCRCHTKFQSALQIIRRIWENFNYSNSFY